MAPFEFDDSDSRTNPSEDGGNDANMVPPSPFARDPLSDIVGPMTRSRAKQVKEHLSALCEELLSKSLTQEIKTKSINLIIMDPGNKVT